MTFNDIFDLFDNMFSLILVYFSCNVRATLSHANLTIKNAISEGRVIDWQFG